MHHPLTGLRISLLIGLLVIVCGCGSSSGREAVSGTVLFNGQPLDHGSIAFHPQTTSEESYFEGSVIINGKYEVPASKGLLPGKYKVVISSGDPKEKDLDVEILPGESGPPAKERIPRKYNAESQEFVEVKQGGPNEFDYDIK